MGGGDCGRVAPGEVIESPEVVVPVALAVPEAERRVEGEVLVERVDGQAGEILRGLETARAGSPTGLPRPGCS